MTLSPNPSSEELEDILFDLAGDAILSVSLHTGDTGVDKAKRRLQSLIDAARKEAITSKFSEMSVDQLIMILGVIEDFIKKESSPTPEQPTKLEGE